MATAAPANSAAQHRPGRQTGLFQGQTTLTTGTAGRRSELLVAVSRLCGADAVGQNLSALVVLGSIAKEPKVASCHGFPVSC
jgi:hypothetical protein